MASLAAVKAAASLRKANNGIHVEKVDGLASVDLSIHHNVRKSESEREVR